MAEELDLARIGNNVELGLPYISKDVTIFNGPLADATQAALAVKNSIPNCKNIANLEGIFEKATKQLGSFMYHTKGQTIAEITDTQISNWAKLIQEDPSMGEFELFLPTLMASHAHNMPLLTEKDYYTMYFSIKISKRNNLKNLIKSFIEDTKYNIEGFTVIEVGDSLLVINR
jgi:hypothetical protein